MSPSSMTLVEIMVVLAIIGIIVGMGVPALTRFANQMRLTATTRQLVGLLSLARSLAISSHEEHAVVVDAEHQEARVIKVASGEALEQVVRLPSAVTVEVRVGGAPATPSQIVFRPTGSLSSRTMSLMLSDQDRHQTITVTGVTGAVSVQ